jgi:hypothetical protein
MTRSTDPLFDQRIADWLENDPVQAPAQVLEIVLAALPSIPRRRGFGARSRLGTVPRNLRWPTAAAAVIAVVLVGSALYLNRPNQPAVGGPSATPDANSSPSPSASPTAVAARAASWTATGSMARSREMAVAVPLRDGKVLVVGGTSNMTDPAAEVYDPETGTWTPTAPMVTPRWQFAAVRLLDGRVLVAAGAGDPGPLATAELYDPKTGSWTATGSLGTDRYDATATLLPDGKVLVAGGTVVQHFFNPSVETAELYDPATGSWAPTGDMHTARSGHIAILLPGGKVLVVGGGNENDTLSYPLSSAEVYDPATGTWAPSRDMLEATSVQSATLLANGRVLVVGGTYEPPTPESVSPHEGIAPTAELYDPTADTWTMTGNLGKIGFNYTATLLSDGRVLVAGGQSVADPGASTLAELYDPTTGTWEVTSDLTQGRAGHTATFMPDGTVLVAGGISGHDADGQIASWLASAELYDPGTGR